MVSTKLLKHRLSLERLIEAKREESRVTRAVLSREAMIAAGGLSVVLALESVLAELIGLVRLWSASFLRGVCFVVEIVCVLCVGRSCWLGRCGTSGALRQQRCLCRQPARQPAQRRRPRHPIPTQRTSKRYRMIKKRHLSQTVQDRWRHSAMPAVEKTAARHRQIRRSSQKGRWTARSSSSPERGLRQSGRSCVVTTKAFSLESMLSPLS